MSGKESKPSMADFIKAAMRQAVEDLDMQDMDWGCNNHPDQPFPCDICAQASDR